jgi:hypothetical protein
MAAPTTSVFTVTAHVSPGPCGKSRDYNSVSVGAYSTRERATAAAEAYAAKWRDAASGVLVPRVKRCDNEGPAYAHMQDGGVVSRFRLDDYDHEHHYCGSLEVFIKELALDAPPAAQHRGPLAVQNAEGEAYWKRKRALLTEASEAARAAAAAAGADKESTDLAAETARSQLEPIIFRPPYDEATREAALAEMAAARPVAAARAAAAAAALPRVRASRAAVEAAAVAAALAAGAVAQVAQHDSARSAASAFDAALNEHPHKAPYTFGHGHKGWTDRTEEGVRAAIARAEVAGAAEAAAAGARAAPAAPAAVAAMA